MNVYNVCAFHAWMFAERPTNSLVTVLLVITQSLWNLSCPKMFHLIFLLSSYLDRFREATDLHVCSIEILIRIF